MGRAPFIPPSIQQNLRDGYTVGFRDRMSCGVTNPGRGETHLECRVDWPVDPVEVGPPRSDGEGVLRYVQNTKWDADKKSHQVVGQWISFSDDLEVQGMMSRVAIVDYNLNGILDDGDEVEINPGGNIHQQDRYIMKNGKWNYSSYQNGAVLPERPLGDQPAIVKLMTPIEKSYQEALRKYLLPEGKK